MRAYYEYEDGTFWAIHTTGGDCFIAHGSKYEDSDWRLADKVIFESPEAAEQKAAKMAVEKSVSAIGQDAEFWRIAIEIDAHTLFYVPDEYMTKELCALAVERNGVEVCSYGNEGA